MPVTKRSKLEIAARRTLKAYQEDGLMTDEHRLTAQLILETVEALPMARPGQQRAAMIKELRELLASLPQKPPAADAADEFIDGLSGT